jgi:O-antigen/teichoic acid export membrane protein
MSLAAHRRAVATGTVWTAFSFAVGAVTGPLINIGLVRSMSHRQFGVLSLATAAAGLISVLVAFGLGPAIAQIAPAEKVRCGEAGERDAIGRTVRLALLATGAAVPMFGIVLIVFLADPNLRGATWTLLCFTPVVAFAPLTGVFMGVFRALHWPRLLSYATMGTSISAGCTILVLILFGHPSPVAVAAARSAGVVVGLGLLGWPLHNWWRAGRQTSPIRAVTSRRVLSFAVALTLATTFVAVLSQLDIFFLGVFHGAQVTGLYSPASAAADFVVAIPMVIASFYVPAAADLATRGAFVEVGDLYRWGTRWVIALAAPALAVLLVCPGAALGVAFGHGLPEMATPLRILALGAFFQTVTGLNGATLDALGVPRQVAVRQLTSLIVAGAGCLLLIPPFGAAGAAWATDLGLLAINVLCSWRLYRQYRILPLDRAMAITIGGFAVGAGGSWGLSGLLSSDLARCAATALLTLLITMLAVMGASGKSERAAVTRRIRSYVRRPAISSNSSAKFANFVPLTHVRLRRSRSTFPTLSQLQPQP